MAQNNGPAESKESFPVPVVIYADSSTASTTKSTLFSSVPKVSMHLPQMRRKVKSTMPKPPPFPSNSVEVRISSPSCADFRPMLLLSSMERVHKGPIWVLKFSPDGRYLATAGEDRKILVWEVTSLSDRSEENGRHNGVIGRGYPQIGFSQSLTQGSGPPLGLEVEFLSTKPIQEFNGHSGDVVDVSWSHSNFLLSASIDKTVRLWHVSKSECVQVFLHSDFVTSVDFHPRDDQYFLTGGFDMKIRLWSVAKNKVKVWAQAPEAVTAARFTPSGRMVVAGLMRGQVYFYSTKGLQYYTQISCKNRQGPQSDGRKVTGLSFRRIVEKEGSAPKTGSSGQSPTQENSDSTHDAPPSASTSTRSAVTGGGGGGGAGLGAGAGAAGAGAGSKGKKVHEQVLVTTNDSRLRVVGLDDFCVVHKYKGSTNATMQIKASYSESGNFIISGSEEGCVHIWDSSQDQQKLTGNDHKKFERSGTCASFEACKLDQPVVTSSVFAPSKSVKSALLKSNLFRTLRSLDHIGLDFSSSVVITSDYEGTLRVFIKKPCIDMCLFEAGPEGSIHAE